MDYYCCNNVNEVRTLVTGPGYISKITINDLGAAGSFITIFDNIEGSGTMIAKIDPTSDSMRSYEIPVVNGLTYVTTGGPGNFTVFYS